jgi:hypothetical protein
MPDHWLFILDADGWLVCPESAPFADEAKVIEAAHRALRDIVPETSRRLPQDAPAAGLPITSRQAKDATGAA